MNEGIDKVSRDWIQTVFDTLYTSDEQWEYIFEGMDPTKRDRYRDDFRAHRPTVILGYPRADSPWPVVAITLQNGATAQDFMGRGLEVVPSPQVKVYSMAETEQVGIVAVTKNSDVTRILTLLAKAAMMVSEPALSAEGYSGYQYQGAQDLSPQVTYLPEDLYVRMQTWSALTLNTVGVATSDKAFAGPVFCGIEGRDLGSGYVGQVVPTT